jgi:[ribosomal protein S18]-alanine N-acetyltransferase
MRKALVSDASSLWALYAACFPVPWPETDFLSFIEHDTVIVTGDPLIGMIIIRVVAGEAEVLSMAVHPDHRKQGIAQSILAYSLNRLAQQNVTQVFLEVAQDNAAARALYARNHFTQIGLRKGYYDRGPLPPMDALVLGRTLTASMIAPAC